MIAIVDYGVGNLRSVQKGLERAGAEAVVTGDPMKLKLAAGVVLPGVGAFGEGMAQLEARGLVLPIDQVISAGKPFLGICLGMQLLFQESEEMGRHDGLGVFKGSVRRFPDRAGLQGAAHGLEPARAARRPPPCWPACRTAASPTSSIPTMWSRGTPR